MEDLPNLMCLFITLQTQPNDGLVFFEQLFGQRDHPTTHWFLLPGGGEDLAHHSPSEEISIGNVLVPLELKSKKLDGDQIVYTGICDTGGVAPAKRGDRQPIQITEMQVRCCVLPWFCGPEDAFSQVE
uniref:Uncharacterized protein n=1 Tax=Vombatus ursinus TaxID=29139 RepID=A0A4X2JYK8_VOMUR